VDADDGAFDFGLGGFWVIEYFGGIGCPVEFFFFSMVNVVVVIQLLAGFIGVDSSDLDAECLDIEPGVYDFLFKVG